MYFQVFDTDHNLRFESNNWPMARSALDFFISLGVKDGRCPYLQIAPEPAEAPND